MDVIEGDPSQSGAERMQGFIFGRELAEVYLLLDYISGRSEKRLTDTIGDDKSGTGDKWIEEICEIRWPPEGSVVEQGLQAKTLLLAKDRLNALTMPANGASIVFTLMVAGDDDAPPIKSHRNRWWRELAFWQSAASPMPGNGNLTPNSTGVVGQATANSVLPPEAVTRSAPLPMGGGGSGGDWGPGGILGEHTASRISLARFAYPGLVKSARRFRRLKNALLLLLFLWLIATCVLSWHITAGREILARLDVIETARIGIQKKIDDIQVGSPSTSATSEKKPKASGSSKLPVTHYCDGVSQVLKGEKIEQFKDVTQLQICDGRQENLIKYANAREDLADWLAPWEWVKGFSHRICGGDRCLHDPAVVLPADKVNQQQWAVVVANVLAAAVLPLCYGFLGAGAAVVRSIWGKMKDSLLSPRDLTLSAGQLALGAVVGACIGLFITTSTGAGTQGGNGLALGVLTPSALSFVAGFGVEGVFVALESLVKRVFNIPDPKP